MAVRAGGVRTAFVAEVLISEAACIEVGTTGTGASERMLVITGVVVLPVSVVVWLLPATIQLSHTAARWCAEDKT